MRCQFALILIAQLVLTGGFASSGGAEEAADVREPVQRTEAEKAFVLDQMRLLLTAIAEIEEGLGSGDMDQVAHAAAPRGRKANVTLVRPATLASKESEAWKMMFVSTRNGFDQIAEQATSHASAATINKTIADTMRNCVACHQAYRISVEAR
jgi:cytochrome c556